MRYGHTLVVGGTGMLLDCTTELARRSGTLTAMARTERSLARLRKRLETEGLPGETVAVDYRDLDRFAAAVDGCAARRGPVDLVVARIDAAAAPGAAARLAERVPAADFVHVLGDADAPPEATALAFRGRPYRQVILASARAGPRSRRPTAEEICAGVLEAILSGRPRTTLDVPCSPRSGTIRDGS